MDIVKRAYLKCREHSKGIPFHDAVSQEIKRLIQGGAYSGRDWPRELGPLPDELRSKRGRTTK